MKHPAAGPDAVVAGVAALIERRTQICGRRPYPAAITAALATTLRRALPDTWVVFVPTGMPLRYAIDRALRHPAAPRTPAYDRLTGGHARTEPAPGRWARWRTLLEPVTAFWFVLIGIGASMASVAGDNAWVLWLAGRLPMAVGLAATTLHVLVGLYRMMPASTSAKPSADDLARALLRDLRRDWWRLTIFRASDVPQRLPVLLVGAGTDGPALLRAYRWWLRRPTAVLVTDDPRVRQHVRRPRRSVPATAMLPLRWLLARVLLPANARRRAFHLLCYGLVALIGVGLLYLDRSLGQPYCLLASSGDDNVTIDQGEPIGYRLCLDGGDLRRDATTWALRQLVGRFAVHRPGPEDNQGLFDVNRIYRENKRVQRLADDGRGLVTVAVVTSLTTRTPAQPVRSVVAEREGLAGAYAAQVRINADRNPQMPYLQLAVVNAGDLTAPPGEQPAAQATHLTQLRDRLRELARDRPLIAAVVTLNSTERVRVALRDSLGRDGVAMISPTMSADGYGAQIAAGKPVFFATGSPNDDQVSLIASYARTQHRKMIYYYPVGAANTLDRQDLYVTTMFCDVWRRAGYQAAAVHDLHGPAPCPTATSVTGRSAAGIELYAWSQGQSADELRASACAGQPRRQPLLFFGGRYTEVAAFTQLVQAACGPHRPQVAVADSATRFLADGELAQLVPHGTAVLIASRGPAITCAALAAGPTPATASTPYEQGRRDDFTDDVRRTLHRCTAGDDAEADRRLAGGWALVNYDTVLLVRDALLRVGLNRRRTAGGTRALVLGCLRGEQCHNTTFPGGYGTIAISNGVGRRTVFLLDVKDLATAFAAASITPMGLCRLPRDPTQPCRYQRWSPDGTSGHRTAR